MGDLEAIDALATDEAEVVGRAEALRVRATRAADPARLREAIGYLDLTSLGGSETVEDVRALCARAARPSAHARVRVAAVCVLPHVVEAAVEAARETGVLVACACGDFPAARAPLAARLAEIGRAVAAGADEIDAVVQRDAIRAGDWGALRDEVLALRDACAGARLKAILGTGELSLAEVARASRVALAAGADFIKTSTGKDRVNATLPAGVAMARALRAHYERTGVRAGLKPAGGIRSAADALAWLELAEVELGPGWRTPERFRIGASVLLDDLVRALECAEG